MYSRLVPHHSSPVTVEMIDAGLMLKGQLPLTTAMAETWLAVLVSKVTNEPTVLSLRDYRASQARNTRPHKEA